MSKQPDSLPLPAPIQRMVFSLRRVGWICFWVQLVLAVISGVILLFAIASSSGQGGNPGTGGGLLFALGGLLVLGFSAYRSFYHTRLAQQLRAPGPARPSRAETVKQMRMSLISNLVGMLLTLLGAEAINGILLAKAVRQPTLFLNPTAVRLEDFIQPLDIFVVLANTHTIVAHFVGIVAAIWLIEQIYKQ